MAISDFILNWALFGFFALAIGVLVYSVFETAIRNQWLAAQDPPTPEELAEAEELSRPGTLNLGSRESAAARHFEHAVRQNPLSRFGGGQTVNTPESHAVVRSWRDERAED